LVAIRRGIVSVENLGWTMGVIIEFEEGVYEPKEVCKGMWSTDPI
jgi:hypothetical protein